MTAAGRRRLQLWRSPPDQPAWARPALLALTGLAAVLYAWYSSGNIEVYYGAAVRSMSTSWHDFFYAAFDPAGTISVDKLPGAFWVQALSSRIFGFHAWSIVLPQVVEGALTVPVVYHAVRRLAGPPAGLVAALLLVGAPATVALDRGNIPDTLLVLLLALAADATVSAVTSGRTRHLALAGLWVGLAFQAKTLEAWLVLPALALTYLVAAPPSVRRRLRDVLLAGLVAGAVSFAWIAVVSLTPTSGRPYVDGSTNDSLVQQVFVYNGFGRLDQPSPDRLLTQSIGIDLTATPPPAWNRLLTGSYGRDTGWLMPAALAALAGGLYTRRKAARGDPSRAGLLLWGGWLVVLFVAFSATTTINAYYTAALSPPIAGLVATGIALAWEHRSKVVAQATVAGTALVSTAYAAWLVPASGTGLPGWLRPAAILLAVLSVLAVGAAIWRTVSDGRPVLALVAGAVVAAAFVPAVAAGSVVANGQGAFDTPFESAAASRVVSGLLGAPALAESLLPKLEQGRFGAPDLMATQTAAVAAPTIFDSGQEVLPIGGFSGTIPSPTLGQIEAMVRAGDFHVVVQSATVTDPRLVWITQHCRFLNAVAGSRRSPTGALDVWFCGSP